jgi:methionyl-tRNA formyltransferase
VAARPRIALLTLPSAMSDEAALRFLDEQAGRVVLVGLSDPMRPAAGGTFGQLRKHLARSGPRILPYLALGFGLPGQGRALRRAAAATGAGCVTVRDVNGPDFAAALAASGAELAVTLHFDQILAAGTIARLPLGGINLHPALLPRHRGPVPAFWALAEGGGETGVSLHRLAPRIDAGDLLGQARVALPAGISALEAARRLHLAGLGLFPPVIEALVAGREPAATALPLLPYCPFPDRAALRGAARRGVRLTRVADIPRILATMRNDTRKG